MNDQYNDVVASHYAAYRPPLHRIILQSALGERNWTGVGLDVGCGTGTSSRALAEFCSRVIAIDPSEAMISRAPHNRSIDFKLGSAESIPVADNSIDLASFAGSLFYADRKATTDELRRVCRPHASIVAYDFEILLDPLLSDLGVVPDPDPLPYDHAVNFSMFPGMKEISVENRSLEIGVSPAEAAHILLSHVNRYSAFANKYNSQNPIGRLENDIASMSSEIRLHANTFWSLYEVS